MRQYAIYTNALGERKCVKLGWSWPGFFFTWIWALVNRLWLVFVGLAAAMAVGSSVAGQGTLESTPLWLQLAYCFVVGANGNSWRESKLRSLGYKYETAVAGKTARAAKLRASQQAVHLDRHLTNGAAADAEAA